MSCVMDAQLYVVDDKITNQIDVDIQEQSDKNQEIMHNQ